MQTKEGIGQIEDQGGNGPNCRQEEGDSPNCRPRSRRYVKLQNKKEEIGRIADHGGDRSNCRPRRRR